MNVVTEGGEKGGEGRDVAPLTLSRGSASAVVVVV